MSGMAASKILILEGISGTGKTSLPYSFSRYLDYPRRLYPCSRRTATGRSCSATSTSSPSASTKRNFLRALYEANYRKDPNFIVLDEMNLARIEYYFAEMLSVLEMPSIDEWVRILCRRRGRRPDQAGRRQAHISPNTWFVRHRRTTTTPPSQSPTRSTTWMPIELNERADAFECQLQPKCHITYEHLLKAF